MKTKFNSKVLFTITLFFVLCCFMTTGVWAAKKVEINSNTARDLITKLNQGNGLAPQNMGAALGLTGDENLLLLRARTDFNRIVHHRYQQTYKGIPVWGHQTVISIGEGQKVVKLHGNLQMDIPTDIANIPSGLDPKGALDKAKKDHEKTNRKATWFYENEEYGTYIYIKKNGKAVVAYVVSFFADNEFAEPSRYIYFVNAKNGKVLHSYNRLTNADGTGPGGNEKIGQYEYGTDFPAFGVTQSGSTCTMNTTDVKTVNLNHGTSGTTAYSYTCPRNTVKEINGAYSPLNDAQYFGQVVYDMYQAWIGQPVLTFQLMMRVHYSTNYENAFWNGSSMTFGDGYSTFYPLVSLDVSAHEVAHGFTDQNSDLIYSGESGGINEAYSDMAGEAAENYSRGSNDWMMGYDIFKNPTGALRYMNDPPLDGISIDHVDDYYSGMDVHYSSGIYNKVFYLLSTSSGWNIRMAFEVFSKANTDYWTPSTNFQQGADGVVSATMDFGYNCGAVANAFAVVGITVVCPGPPTADFSASPTSGGYPLTVNFTDLSGTATSWLWDFGDTNTSTAQNPTHVYSAIGSYTVTLTATNSSGSDIETKTNYITVTAPIPPVADFNASTTNPYIGQTVVFTDATANSPTAWSWTFDGGTPGTSTAQNPSVIYNTVGTYDVTLVATNVAGEDTEIKLGYINVTDVPLVYCDSQGNNYSYEYIGNVMVGDLDNTSAGSNYTDYTAMAAHVTAGNSVSVSLTPVFPSTTYTEYWKIWIDYNIDGDFDDAGEEVFSDVSTATVSGSFTVPLTAVGTTRMRVSMKWNAAQTPCETFSYGEVEDYSIVISGGVVDPPVAEFSASATTVFEGDSVDFTDLSTNNPTSWAWTFTGGTPGSSTSQNPTVQYNTAGTYAVELIATNSAGSDTELKTAYITVNPVVVDPPAADFTASATTILEGGSVTFTDTSTNTPTSWAWTFDGGTPGTSTAQNPTITYNTAGVYTVELTAANSGGSDTMTKTGYITVEEPSGGVVFETGTVAGVGNSWQTVNLTNTYASPVVVCTTGIANSSALPAVVRVRNAGSGSFDVMVQNPSGSALSGRTVHYTVVEEGVYTVAEHGVKMEAVTVNSSLTASKSGGWVTEARSYSNSYTTPVVLGQVMTYNDTAWSVFWANGPARATEPTSTAFYAGKNVGEDPVTARVDETIGYIVFESGSGTINGVPYAAALGADTVRGPSNTSTGYTYSISVANASVALLSVNGLDGGNGGWPALYGASPLTGSAITLVFDEDQVGDSERAHTPERVAYVVFGQ